MSVDVKNHLQQKPGLVLLIEPEYLANHTISCTLDVVVVNLYIVIAAPFSRGGPTRHHYLAYLSTVPTYQLVGFANNRV